ncbi:MAG: hypothetical protein ACTH2Q_20430 [Propionibacteriaceae bacterium]
MRAGDHPAATGPAAALTVIGGTCVVLGGLVAAVTGPLDLAHGSWTAAFLVLVAGVAQTVMGRARTWWPRAEWPRSRGWLQLGCWNAGSALVIGGTLVSRPLLVDLGSILLVVALVLALVATRADPTGRPTSAVVPAFVASGYRVLLLVLALSIPVGILLSHLRHG